jgi:cell division protein FtsN
MAKVLNLNTARQMAANRQAITRKYGEMPSGAQAGGTILGFLAGLVIGLVVAVVVAIFITRAPVPFVNKAGHKSSDRVIEPKAGVPLPDPNQSLNSKSKPNPNADKAGADKSNTGTTKPADAGGSVLGNVFNNGQQAGQAAPPPPPPPVPSTSPTSPPPNATPAKPTSPSAPVAASTPAGTTTSTPDNPEDKTTYIIQAGAFRVQEDAEAMKAKLALAGYEARILTADVSGQPLYRVRLTPYKVLDDVNKAKAKLAENGIESTVIRMK